MGCGCKKKHEVPAEPSAKIIMVENGDAKIAPPPPPPPPLQSTDEVNGIVNKLNEILTP